VLAGAFWGGFMGLESSWKIPAEYRDERGKSRGFDAAPNGKNSQEKS
jgi:hypothetical protein